jgi:hypothetical protein
LVSIFYFIVFATGDIGFDENENVERKSVHEPEAADISLAPPCEPENISGSESAMEIDEEVILQLGRSKTSGDVYGKVESSSVIFY